MKATIPYIEKKFEEFNQQMFAGVLPKLPIELSDAKTFLGVCVYKKRKTKEGKIECYDFKLRINIRIDLPESEVEDIIIHEMIHYFVGFNNLEDSSTHGQVFKHIMNTINEKFGRNLMISHKASKEEKEQLYDTRRRWHVVAVVYFKDGQTGIKVLPRIHSKIIEFCSFLKNQMSIVSYRLYMTDEPYFNRYPTSSALRISYIDSEEIEQLLKSSAEELNIINDRVVPINE
ncbi:MAG: SprT-like domain-containing protein [Prevotella sp.]|nr:SprT-like domain-containing protein [Prevotella sp.]